MGPMKPAEALSVPARERVPFQFDLVERNEDIKDQVQRKHMSTGTTIAGMIFKDGVILGADTRAGMGTSVADKNCQKLHPLAPNIYAGGAGTAADCDKVGTMVQSALALHRFNTGRECRVRHAEAILKTHLHRYQGHLGVYYMLGGVDVTGPRVVSVHAAGSTFSCPFSADGSGGFAALSVLETNYRDDMEEEEAKELVARAIFSGQTNDLGSGSNIDLCVIKRVDGETKVDYLRPYKRPYDRILPARGQDFPKHSTLVLKETFHKMFEVRDEAPGPAMEVDK